jgi:nucleoside 2-deoxyribosyltransferase
MGEVWTAINQADIIIADCTNRNPNVFYEVGIAHAMGKQTILMVQTIDDIPFDLRGLRVIEYRYDPRGMTQFEEALRKTIMNIKTA